VAVCDGVGVYEGVTLEDAVRVGVCVIVAVRLEVCVGVFVLDIVPDAVIDGVFVGL
jgi:hypothetical protein